MKSKEITEKIECLREEIEKLKLEREVAWLAETGIVVGDIVETNGKLPVRYKVSKGTSDNGLYGYKQLKNGNFSDREQYAGILNFSCKLVQPAERETEVA